MSSEIIKSMECLGQQEFFNAKEYYIAEIDILNKIDEYCLDLAMFLETEASNPNPDLLLEINGYI